VGLLLQLAGGRVRRQDLFERLRAVARPAGQREERGAVADDRAWVDARVTGGGGVDQLIEGHLVGPGKGHEQFQDR